MSISPLPSTRRALPEWAPVLSGNVLQLGLTLLTSVAVARSLGPAQFGVYAVLGIAANVLGVLLDFGLSDVGVIRLAAASDPAEFRSRARTFFWLRAGLAGFSCLGLALFAGFIGGGLLGLGNSAGRVLLVLAGGFVASATGALSSLLQSQRRYRALAVLPVINSGVTVVLAVYLALSGAMTVESVLFWLGVFPAVVAYAFACAMLPDRGVFVPPGFDELRSEAGVLFGQGFWLWIANISAAL